MKSSPLLPLSIIPLLVACNGPEGPDSDGTQIAELGTGPAAAVRFDTVRMGGTGYVTGVVAHPNTRGLFYARTDVGGAYRWEAATGTWVQLLDWVDADHTSYYGVESLALDPQNAQKVFALVGTHYWPGGGALLRSNDRGKSWSVTGNFSAADGAATSIYAHGNGNQRGSGEKVAVDPKNGNILFVGTRRNGLLKSTDGGATLRAVTSLPVTTTSDDNGISFVAFAPGTEAANTATRTIIVGVSRTGAANLYKSTDGGATWTAISNAPRTASPYRGIVVNHQLYVTYDKPVGAPEKLGVLRFPVAGGAYADLTPTGCYTCEHDEYLPTGKLDRGAASWGGIDLDPANPQRLVVSSRGGYVARQNGLGWGDYVMVSTDGGKTYQRILDHRSNFDNNGIPFGDRHAVHWANAVAFDPFNTKRLFVVSGHGVLGTTDLTDGTGPTSWRYESRGIEEGVFYDAVSLPNGRLVSSMLDYDGFTHVDPAKYADGNRLLIGGTAVLATAEAAPQLVAKVNSRLLLSTDGGDSFSELTRPTSAAGGSVALSAKGTTLLYRPAGSTTFYTTRDRGQTWTPATGLVFNTVAGRGDRDAFRVFADGVDDNRFYFLDRNNTADGPGGQLYIGTVGSSGILAWAKGGMVPANRAAIPRAVPGVTGQVYVPVGTAGLMASRDGGKTFSALPSVAVAAAVSFGPPADCGAYASIFIYGIPKAVLDAEKAAGIKSTTALYRSDDGGTTWLQSENEQHRFGGLANGGFITADRRVFGRVFRSSAGRGIPYAEPQPGSVPTAVKSCLAATTVRSGGSVRLDAQLYGLPRPIDALTFELDGARKSTHALTRDDRFSWGFWNLAPGNYRVRATAKSDGQTTVGGWTYFRYDTPTHALAVNNPWLRNAHVTFELPGTFAAGTPVSLRVEGTGVGATFYPNTAAAPGINYARIPGAKNFAPGTYTVTLNVGGAPVATIQATKFGG